MGWGGTIRVSAYKVLFFLGRADLLRDLDGVQGGLEESSHFHAHFLLLLRIQFLYARCNSQQAQLVSVVALEMLLFPTHGGRSQSGRLFSSSVFFYFPSSLLHCLSPGRFSQGDLRCAGHIRQHGKS